MGTPYHCVPYGKQLSGPHVYKGFHQRTTPLCGYTQPLCTVLENFQGHIVNKGFPIYKNIHFQDPMFIRGSPYKTAHITTVWAHTTMSHITTLWAYATNTLLNFDGPMENNCQGPILIRVSSIWMKAENHFVNRHNHYVHPTPTPPVSQ